MSYKIILFEDKPQYESKLLHVLNNKLGSKGSVILFKPGKGTKQTGTFEERLESDLNKSGFLNASLIVADMDLSEIQPYRGLSEQMVRSVADKFGIPECCYARGEKRDQDLLTNAERREARIAVTIEEGNDLFAERIVSIADGFSFIENQLPSALKKLSQRSPGHLLGKILDKLEYAEKIELYASGDQNRLASIPRGRGNEDLKIRLLACWLGYWLWDSVIRYPGVVVNEIAASSYLNIYEGTFRKTHAIRDLFKKALYRGPFAEAVGPLWWRGMLDDILVKDRCSDGREYASKKLRKTIRRSECYEDPTKPAGYYCMLKKKPVSLEKSRGGLPWFPRGADLARVSLRGYGELGPWL